MVRYCTVRMCQLTKFVPFVQHERVHGYSHVLIAGQDLVTFEIRHVLQLQRWLTAEVDSQQEKLLPQLHTLQGESGEKENCNTSQICITLKIYLKLVHMQFSERCFCTTSSLYVAEQLTFELKKTEVVFSPSPRKSSTSSRESCCVALRITLDR